MGTDNQPLVLDTERLREVTLEDEDLMREIVAALLEDTSRQILLLAEAIQSQDSPRCMRLAHYSKGACANVGADRAAAMFKSIERDASNQQFQACERSLANLSSEMDLLRSQAGSL